MRCWFAPWFLAAAAVGCTGELAGSANSGSDSHGGEGSPTSSGGSPTSAGGAPTSGGADDSQCRPPPSRVVRLSKLELQNSLADILGTTKGVALPDDAKFLNFSSNAEALVTPPFAKALQSSAEALAASFRDHLDPTWFGADCAASDASARMCATTFMKSYGQRAFRRPIAQADVDGLLAVYEAGRETGVVGDVQDRFKAGIDYTMRAILQSPDFVYRVELGDPSAVTGGVTHLTPYELASSLSYMLTASPPDDALFAAAAADELASPGALESHARRLMAAMPERFAAQQSRFVREWLAIDFTVPAWNKNTTIYPLYSPALKSALDQETSLYLADWVARGPTLTALFTRSDTFVNAVNAPLYGLTASAGDMTKVSLDPKQRSGILTMPAFLGTRAHADSSAPILRGISIVRGVMCVTIPPPPPNVPPLPAITDTSFTTTRDRVEKHVAAAPCAGCHDRINPLGYPFEQYDGLGAYRSTENGYDVNPSGAIIGTQSSDQPVAGAVELSRALANSADVQVCFARQVFRSTFGREETVADECSLRAAAQAYRAKGLDLRELLVALVKSQTFAQRASNSN